MSEAEAVEEFGRRVFRANITHHDTRDHRTYPAWVARFYRGRAEVDDYGFPDPDAVIRRLRRLSAECDVRHHSGDRFTVDFVVFPQLAGAPSSAVFRHGQGECALLEFKTHVPSSAVAGVDLAADREALEGIRDLEESDQLGERDAVVAVANLVERAGPPVSETVVWIYPPTGRPHVQLGAPKDSQSRSDRAPKYKRRAQLVGPVPPGALLDFLAGLKRVVEG